MKVYSITVSGYIAHFRRPIQNQSKQTYRIPPRTTICGFLAGGLGLEPDSYYQYFTPDKTQIGVRIHTDISIKNTPKTFKSIESTQSISFGESTVGMLKPAEMKGSVQRKNVEYIRNPTYTFYITTSDDDLEEKLHGLSEDRWMYPPYLGSNECGASIKDVSTHNATQIHADKETVHSIIPAPTVETIIPAQDYSVKREKIAVNFTQTNNGRRKPTNYITYNYTKQKTNNPTVIPKENTSFISINNHNILLY